MSKKIFFLGLFLIVFFSFFWFSGQKKLYKKTELNLDSYATLPVIYDGRIKPIDTVARNLLKVISGKETVRYQGNKIPAIYWYLIVASQTPAAFELEQFLITNKDLLNFLQLPSKGDTSNNKVKKTFLYSFKQIEKVLGSLDKISEVAQTKKNQSQILSPLEDQALDLKRKITLFLTIIENNNVFFENTDINNILVRRKAFTQLSQILLVPPTKINDDWRSLIDSYLAYIASGVKKSGVTINAKEENIVLLMRSSLASFYGYFVSNKEDKESFSKQFNKILKNLHETFSTNREKVLMEFRKKIEGLEKSNEDIKNLSQKTQIFVELKDLKSQESVWSSRYEQVSFEKNFNQQDIFSLSIFFYILLLLLSSMSFFDSKYSKGLKSLSFYLMVGIFFIHSYGIISRIVISNYPPVTNLYSSAIFVAWVAILGLIILELINKIGVGSFLASLIGIATLVIANNLSGDGDTLEMKQAVLDTRFWLTTHVITITIGYAVNFILGALAIFIVFVRGFSKKITLVQNKKIMSSFYGILAFGLIFSIIGTILGGLWADDSWGRFWGWDPKENGALMIVIWDVILIHILWGRLLSSYALATLAIFTNVITAWSWFGTNQLGVGLHSYGFNESGRFWLLVFVLLNLIFMFIGALRNNSVKKI